MQKIVFSGVQPSGMLTLGNYLGAIRQFVALQDEADQAYYCVVDLHATTVRHDPKTLRDYTLMVSKLYLASGIDPNRATIFVQSHVPEHAELAWLLQCVARTGELSRMTQFKEKGGDKETVSVGLYTYPVLMAADILLYQTTHVPVGEDQKQHLELTRDLAERFNRDYGEVFRLPETIIPDVGSRIMSLDDPTKKMSKSNPSEMGRIHLLDPDDIIEKKIMRAVTDSENVIRYDPEKKPGVSNLLAILALVRGEHPEVLAEAFSGQGYGALKRSVADAVLEVLRPIKERYEHLTDEETLKILREGADRAQAIARKTYREAAQAFGYICRESS
ncbi:MAG: tryptophan--tRNA ligase [Candidatus Carbobacillus altaicus]|uniref:Tryptophan--tRNA ligase n=1 Tax=Candidatus Carbonibacillus altaicus TaxID=2163959 RepID=A0A2R6Y1L5_9BACL|nr:tryptophan--tRNA ligase [Candidatus Carbobacillus altaicus]PTQ56567.1 MAG: Tryptophanyl-tRNA synthetase [Candidatus Carbobacillus altaicus]